MRSIQYYDQQGILSPSAKGPQNQRLYTQDDVERLYEVICLKYAGLTLSQVKDAMASPGVSDTPATVAMTLENAIRETEGGFATLLRRYETLRSLARIVAEAQRTGGGLDWEAMAHTLPGEQDEGSFFLHLSYVYGDEGAADDGCPDDEAANHELIAEWHGVMADCAALMRAGEPLDSPRSRTVARRAVELQKRSEKLPNEQKFLFIESVPANHHPASRSFRDLRHELSDYLDRLMRAFPDGGAPRSDGTAPDADGEGEAYG